MSQATDRATRRDLRRALGPAGLDVVATHEQILQRLAAGLAAQLQQYQTDRTRTDQELDAVGIDRVRNDRQHAALEDGVQRLGAQLSEERSHRLKLADEQRRYVDGEDRATRVTLAAFIVHRTLWQRLRWLLTGR